MLKVITPGWPNFPQLRSASEIHPTKRSFLKDNFDIFQFLGKQPGQWCGSVPLISVMWHGQTVSICEADTIGFEPGQWPVDWEGVWDASLYFILMNDFHKINFGSFVCSFRWLGVPVCSGVPLHTFFDVGLTWKASGPQRKTILRVHQADKE